MGWLPATVHPVGVQEDHGALPSIILVVLIPTAFTWHDSGTAYTGVQGTSWPIRLLVYSAACV